MNYKQLSRGIITLSGVVAAMPIVAQPNIIFIMSDDHTSQAISAYGGILADIMPTPNIDRIANEGIRMDNCFVTNSISTPSRAAIMTGQYSNLNGVYTLYDPLDPAHPNVAKELQAAGYQTGIYGKWHLHNEPTGFDHYKVICGQGKYFDPPMVEKGEWGDPRVNQMKGQVNKGHSTDVITDASLEFMKSRDKSKPFALMCHYKSPHRFWQPAERFNDLLKDVTIPEPENLYDDYEGKAEYTKLLRLRIEDMNERDVKHKIPTNLSQNELRSWIYQYYIKDYLRCVAGVDENVGRILDYLDENGLTENTIVIYTGDQGFFLGEHGWFDKRLMYEESLHAPFLMRYPKEIKAGSVSDELLLNIDYAPLFLDYAGVSKPSYMQGESFRSIAGGITPQNWRDGIYYRYWTNADGDHNVPGLYGIRTDRYKLTYIHAQTLGHRGTSLHPVAKEHGQLTPEWELYDLKLDPNEMHNIYNDPKYREIILDLKYRLLELKEQYGDQDDRYPQMKAVNEKYFWK